MKTIVLQLKLDNDELVPLMIAFIRRAMLSSKPEEVRYNLTDAARKVGESQRSLIRHANHGYVERSHKGRGCTFEEKELERYCWAHYKRACLKEW